MESFEFELPTTYIEVEDIWLRTGLGILEGVWGPGLPAGRIFEMHSDLGLDMTKVALQVAAGVVQRGLDVAFFDVNRVLTDHMISSYIKSKDPIGDKMLGRFDHFCPWSFDKATAELHATCTQDVRHDLIIIDSFTDLNINDNRTDAENGVSPEPRCERENFQEQFLLYCRDRLSDTLQSMLILNHTAAVTSPPGASPASTLHLDGVCDTRTALALHDSIYPADQKNQADPFRGFAAWNTKDYRRGLSPILPLIPGSDGSVDEPMSLLTYLIHNEVITWEGDDFNVPGEAEPVVGLEKLREWAVVNDQTARRLVREVVSQ